MPNIIVSSNTIKSNKKNYSGSHNPSLGFPFPNIVFLSIFYLGKQGDHNSCRFIRYSSNGNNGSWSAARMQINLRPDAMMCREWGPLAAITTPALTRSPGYLTCVWYTRTLLKLCRL